MIKDPKAQLIWYRTVAFENGISPSEFNKSKLSDIKEVMAVKSAVAMKGKRNQKVQDLMNQVKTR